MLEISWLTVNCSDMNDKTCDIALFPTIEVCLRCLRFLIKNLLKCLLESN